MYTVYDIVQSLMVVMSTFLLSLFERILRTSRFVILLSANGSSVEISFWLMVVIEITWSTFHFEDFHSLSRTNKTREFERVEIFKTKNYGLSKDLKLEGVFKLILTIKRSNQSNRGSYRPMRKQPEVIPTNRRTRSMAAMS